ncbi:hypothetical protein [Photobacterium sanguinicancri]|uniref:8-oxoguanine DNA glycosylase OGG fold protein n=1 Tax=Photobacterium sanguinicancri TaxID=875932 RepID=UPI0026E15D4E|nr:hypothetical protein [Photobacterium sanguinicancri]MDO6499604.1 hypothetical protein [Photobacterium sanguinicancri]
MAPSFLINNLEKIQQIQQPSFKIANSYFKYRQYDVIDEILGECTDGHIGRKQVTAYFENQNYYKGFFAAMIWGGISTGGVTGDNLTKLLNVAPERLESIVLVVKQLLEQQKFSQAYNYMEGEGKLKGLGDAYFTKLFFFVAAADVLDIIPPIFDKWTKLAYCALLIDEGNEQLAKQYISRVEGVDVKLRSATRSAAFEDFVLRMNRWAKECGVKVNQLESYIFGTHRSKNKTDNNPRFYFESFVSERSLDVFSSPVTVSASKPKEKVSASPLPVVADLKGFAEHFKTLDKAPTQEQLLPMLICYFEQSAREDINCRDLAYALQDQYGFWDASKAKDKHRAAYDAIAAFFVYGELPEHREKYIRNVQRRARFTAELGVNLIVSQNDNRTFSLTES